MPCWRRCPDGCSCLPCARCGRAEVSAPGNARCFPPGTGRSSPYRRHAPCRSAADPPVRHLPALCLARRRGHRHSAPSVRPPLCRRAAPRSGPADPARLSNCRARALGFSVRYPAAVTASMGCMPDATRSAKASWRQLLNLGMKLLLHCAGAASVHAPLSATFAAPSRSSSVSHSVFERQPRRLSQPLSEQRMAGSQKAP